MKQNKTISEKLKEIRESINWKNSPEKIKQITKIIDALLKKVMSLNEESKEKKQDNYLQQQHTFLEKEVEINRIAINELVQGYKDLKEKNTILIETIKTFKNILSEMNDELNNFKEQQTKRQGPEEIPLDTEYVDERAIAIENYFKHTYEFTAYDMAAALEIPVSTLLNHNLKNAIKNKKVEKTERQYGRKHIYRSLIIERG